MASGGFDQLALCLARAEEWSSRLSEANADQIIQVVEGLDCAHAIIDRLNARGARYPAEEIQRIETIEHFLRRDLQKVARKLAAAEVSLGAIAAERAEQPDAWWWRLGQLAREHRTQRNLRIVRTLILIGIALGVVYVLLQTVFAPDPVVMARVQAVQSAQQAIFEDNDPELAVQSIDAGFAELERLLAERDQTLKAVNTIEMWVWRGVADGLLGNEEEAGYSYAQAEDQNPWQMRAERLMAYRILGETDAAFADAQALIEIEPEHPGSYMLLGDVYRDQGRLLEADQAYQQAEDLAVGNEAYNQIFVLIRQRRAELIQGGAQ